MKTSRIINNICNVTDNFGTIGSIIKADRVMVLSPHHDDEVVGCGGTLIKYLKNNANIEIVYMTDGRHGLKKEDVHIRKEEAINAWKNCSNIHQTFFDFEDRKLGSFFEEATGLLLDIINKFKPDIIFTPWLIDLHDDHRVTSFILNEALKKGCYFSPIILCYEVMCPLYSNHSVNITNEFEEKMRIIDTYKSQHSYLNLKETILNLNKFRASMLRIKRIRFAEGFYVCKSNNFIENIDKICC